MFWGQHFLKNIAEKAKKTNFTIFWDLFLEVLILER